MRQQLIAWERPPPPSATTAARRAVASNLRCGASPCTAAQRSVVLRVELGLQVNLGPYLTLAAATSTSGSE